VYLSRQPLFYPQNFFVFQVAANMG
jgi:hypothetical protein